MVGHSEGRVGHGLGLIRGMRLRVRPGFKKSGLAERQDLG